MKITLQIKLLPDEIQHAALKETTQVFNDAYNTIAEVAFREQCASKFALQKLVYEDVRKQFGLSAQLAIRAIAKVVDAYKRNKSKMPQRHLVKKDAIALARALGLPELLVSFRTRTKSSLLIHTPQ